MKKTSASKTKTLVQIALFAAFISVTAQITIPVQPIPFSLVTLGVCFAGAMLPPFQAAGCVGVYLAMGMIGLPVFSGFRGGIQVLAGPGGGFLLGFVFLAVCSSLALNKKYGRPAALCIIVLGLAAFYLAACLWFSFITGAGLQQSFFTCVLPFILPDLVKIAAAIALTKKIKIQHPGLVQEDKNEIQRD